MSAPRPQRERRTSVSDFAAGERNSSSRTTQVRKLRQLPEMRNLLRCASGFGKRCRRAMGVQGNEGEREDGWEGGKAMSCGGSWAAVATHELRGLEEAWRPHGLRRLHARAIHG